MRAKVVEYRFLMDPEMDETKFMTEILENVDGVYGTCLLYSDGYGHLVPDPKTTLTYIFAVPTAPGVKDATGEHDMIVNALRSGNPIK